MMDSLLSILLYGWLSKSQTNQGGVSAKNCTLSDAKHNTNYPPLSSQSCWKLSSSIVIVMVRTYSEIVETLSDLKLH